MGTPNAKKLDMFEVDSKYLTLQMHTPYGQLSFMHLVSQHQEIILITIDDADAVKLAKEID